MTLIPSPPEADDLRMNHQEWKKQLEQALERNARLALSNRMLRDRIEDLCEIIRSFGMDISP